MKDCYVPELITCHNKVSARRSVTPARCTMALFLLQQFSELHSLTRFERLGGWMDIGVGFNLSSRTPVASERIVLCDRARNFCAIHRKSRSVQQLKFDTARVDPQKPLLRRANGPKWPPTRRPFPHTPTRSASACCVQSPFLACC